MNLSKPNLDWTKIVGVACIYFGVLIFIIAIHIAAISTTGDVADTLSMTFRVVLYMYYAGLIFGGAGLIIKFLKWVTWQTQTPEWERRERK